MLRASAKWVLLMIVAGTWSAVASAGAISCGNQYRTATLGSAELCQTGSGNTKESDIESYFGGDWDKLGGVAGAKNTAGSLSFGYLTVTLLSGSWGNGGLVNATWAIDQSFWTVYGAAALSIHVGNGSYDPDHFAWTITQGQTSGTWSYQKLSGNGGGLSNMHLWGSGEPIPVPPVDPEPPVVSVSEPNIALLLLLGLLAIVVVRRRA